jgi:asparagine synthase (glutamine-hydrolysing)
MCGIAGFYNLDGAPVDLSVLTRMTDLQRHRGPDDHGAHLFSLVTGGSFRLQNHEPLPAKNFEGALGFNRLSILDLSKQGHQPMLNADGNVIIAFNGEVYNAMDYRAELESAGFQFRSHTDTEVILYLYERHGIDGMLSRLNGMFVIVIIDLRKREIHVVRDHMGVKPLYWTMVGRTVLFASEAKSFLAHPDFRAEIAIEHLDEYLAFRYVAGEDYLLKGVRQLRPGHCMRITGDGVAVSRYWQIPPGDDRRAITPEEAQDRVDHLLRASVKSQLISDVPVGCQLSGGIDSSLISVFARSHFDASSMIPDTRKSHGSPRRHVSQKPKATGFHSPTNSSSRRWTRRHGTWTSR